MKRILIVDDAIDLGRLLQDVIKSAFPEVPVTVVPSAEEALLEASRYTIDLLVTDVRLPGMTGMELIRKIRTRQPQIKVVVMTGLMVDERLQKQKEEAKPDAFLPKPIIPTVFIDTIERLIGVEQLPKPTAGAKPPEPARQEPARQDPGSGPNLTPAQNNLLNELKGILPGEPAEKTAGVKDPSPTRRFTTGGLGTTRLNPQRLATGPLQAQQPEAEGLSSILSGLRGSLGAVVAMLLDERGHSVAQAGDLPDPELQQQIIVPLLSSLSASAKVSYLLGMPDAEMAQAYRGAELDLVTAPVGQYTLLIGLKAGRGSIRIALAVEEALGAQADVAAALLGMGLRVQSAVEIGAPETLLEAASGPAAEADVPPEILDTPLGQDQNLEKFEELFSKKKTGQLPVEDADAFWDAAASGDKKDISQPGVLTFEQARKLGLLPPDQEQ